jgi:quercetin 2,3-dioxygenase
MTQGCSDDVFFTNKRVCAAILAPRAWLKSGSTSPCRPVRGPPRQTPMERTFSSLGKMMRVVELALAKKTFPTGNPDFAVMQAFPAGISAINADPFLMCDFFGPTPSNGKMSDPDKFEVPWHPHRGMDILTYMIEGVGRHADSLGNRAEFPSPGMQWISVGSGIEHAEGGGTPAGESMAGFQIWINVPSDQKMNPPRYGTEPPDSIPTLPLSTTSGGVNVRVLAGEYTGARGPFQTVQPVLLLDVRLQKNTLYDVDIDNLYDNCIVFVYKGRGEISSQEVTQYNVLRLDASHSFNRRISISSGISDEMNILIFAGKKLNQPIAWHGPFVMTTSREIEQTLLEYRRGQFPPVRVSWDYKRIATKPKDEL